MGIAVAKCVSNRYLDVGSCEGFNHRVWLCLSSS